MNEDIRWYKIPVSTPQIQSNHEGTQCIPVFSRKILQKKLGIAGLIWALGFLTCWSRPLQSVVGWLRRCPVPSTPSGKSQKSPWPAHERNTRHHHCRYVARCSKHFFGAKCLGNHFRLGQSRAHESKHLAAWFGNANVVGRKISWWTTEPEIYETKNVQKLACNNCNNRRSWTRSPCEMLIILIIDIEHGRCLLSWFFQTH